MSYPVIPDLFEAVVTNVSAAMGKTVYFHQGHMLEIANVVKEMSIDPNVDHRYPLIALQHDITERDVKYIGTEFDCKMYIITLSRPEYIAKKRMSTIFKPILIPIMDEFFKQIANSGYFLESNIDDVRDKCKRTNRLFWGSSSVMGNEANIFKDWVDCIELDFTGLTAICNC